MLTHSNWWAAFSGFRDGENLLTTVENAAQKKDPGLVGTDKEFAKERIKRHVHPFLRVQEIPTGNWSSFCFAHTRA